MEIIMKITVLDRNTITNGDISLAELETLGEVSFYDLLSGEEIVKVAKDADAILCNKANIDSFVVNNCLNLKYVGLFATGYNNIDLEACSVRNIVVANAPGYSTNSVAQNVFSFILELSGKLSQYNASVHDGDWIKSKQFSYFPFPIQEIYGKTLGIYGFGTIGKAVAKIADAFGMKVIISTRTKPKDSPYLVVDKEQLFAESDFLTLHCPLTPETRELVNKDTLSLMKPTAYLINTSRGGVINESELAAALNGGKIAGAGLDVLTLEPMKEGNPLLTAKNCLITPHIAWASFEARKRLITLVADNFRAFISGKSKNVVN
ncbi:MAG: D-2-hydroxyacid dehydrogenase [Eubacteriales bacterium]|nr:D-2-hydroxyacid dehydrogenase [Eubacteriales bacterium]MDD4475823.1 D-2-hydroxyacid dehydrogenase [Eubacteriales bacterium]